MQNNNSKPKIDLKKRTYLYALSIIKFTDVQFIDALLKNDFSVQVIVKQLIRSAASIGANIMELRINFIGIKLLKHKLAALKKILLISLVMP